MRNRLLIVALVCTAVTSSLAPSAAAATQSQPATKLRYEPGDRSLTLKWNSPVDDPNFKEVVVRFQRANSDEYIHDAPIVYRGRGERVVVSDLIDDGAYNFAVYALNHADECCGGWDGMFGIRTLRVSRVTSSTSTDTLTFGSSVVIRGRLFAYYRMEEQWLPLPSRPMYLEQRLLPDGAWQRVDYGWTGEGYEIDGTQQGSIRFSRRPAVNTEYRLAYPGYGHEGPSVSSLTTTADGDTVKSRDKAGVSRARLTRVRPRVKAQLARTSIRLGRRVVMTGSVRPGRPDQLVYLQRRRNDGTWRTVAEAKLRQDRTYRVAYEPASTGSKTLRVRRPATRRNIAGRSPIRIATVR